MYIIVSALTNHVQKEPELPPCSRQTSMLWPTVIKKKSDTWFVSTLLKSSHEGTTTH